MINEKWKSIESLRITDRDYSGMRYSMSYAKRHKNKKDMYAQGGTKSVAIEESIHIKKEIDGSIVYQVKGRDHLKDAFRDYNTQFGVFHSEDNGEFGGDLITPSGVKIAGNFKYVFDLQDKVYAISTLGHLVIASTSIYRFDKDMLPRRIYGTKDRITMKVLETLGESSEEYYEDLCCYAVEVKDDEAYAVLTGTISRKCESERIWGENSVWICRLLRIKDGEVELVKEFTGKVPSMINDVIVDRDTLYISCDKMICIYDLKCEDVLGGVSYRTCISLEDEADLIATKEDRS